VSDDAPNATEMMTDRTVVVTGANTGIGEQTALALARMGARVVITSRDAGRGAAAAERIASQCPRSHIEVMPLDLADFASVRSFAAAFIDRHDRLDVLIHNAGLVLRSRTITVDGNETTFQVNHLGPFLLTALFGDLLTASAPARVVVVSSDAHRQARHGIDFDDLTRDRRYRGFSVYGQTKLANILFTTELARRLDGTRVTANSLHPGLVASRFARDGDTGVLGRLAMPLLRPVSISQEAGARTSVFLASEPSLEAITGEYWYKCAIATPSSAARDDAAAQRLWELSVALTAPDGAEPNHDEQGGR